MFAGAEGQDSTKEIKEWLLTEVELNGVVVRAMIVDVESPKEVERSGPCMTICLRQKRRLFRAGFRWGELGSGIIRHCHGVMDATEESIGGRHGSPWRITSRAI